MIEWKVEKRKLSELKGLPNNPRTISKQAFELLKERLTKRGFHDIFKLDSDNIVLSGNQRKRAMLSFIDEMAKGMIKREDIDKSSLLLGLEKLGEDYEVDVKVPVGELSITDRKKVIIESNVEDGEFDIDALANEYEDALEGMGMDDLMPIDVDYSDKNKEIDVDELENDLNYECPKCGFKFEKPQKSA